MSHAKTWKHVLLWVLASSLVVFILIFVALFVYYLWQFKYGDYEKRVELSYQYEDKFTTISDNATAPLTIDNPTQYIRDYNPTLGNPDASTTIIAFIDFECPYCQENEPILRKIAEQYSPVVRVIFKHIPLTGTHPNAFVAAIGSTCAQEQNRFWDYADALFKETDRESNTLYNVASQIGLNVEQFHTCFVEQTYKKNVEKDMIDALEIGIAGTPTHIVNNHVIEGVLSQEEWNTLLLEALNQ